MNEQQVRQLFLAVVSGNKARVEQLVGQIGNINRLSDEGTLLHAAAQNGHVPIIEFLLSKNADINATDKNNTTPLQAAIERGQSAAIDILIAQRADVEAADRNGARSLHWAVQMGLNSIAEKIIDSGAQIDSRAKFDSTPLHIGARTGFADMVDLLVRRNANIEALTNQQYTPLHVACMKNQSDAALMLIRLKANVNAKTNKKMTPLHIAAGSGMKDVVKALLEANANPSAVDADGNKANDLSLQKGYAEISQLIKDAQSSFSGTALEVEPGTRFKQVLALYSYNAETFPNDFNPETDLSFTAGAVIRNVQVTENGWWRGDFEGKTGEFPSNYVGAEVIQVVEATHNFYASRPDEMSVKKGDSIQVYEKRRSGYLRGICGNSGGLFPANHVITSTSTSSSSSSSNSTFSPAIPSSLAPKDRDSLPSNPSSNTLGGRGKKSLSKSTGMGVGIGISKPSPPASLNVGPPQLSTGPPPLSTGPPPLATGPPPLTATPPLSVSNNPFKTGSASPSPSRATPPSLPSGPPSLPTMLNTGSTPPSLPTFDKGPKKNPPGSGQKKMNPHVMKSTSQPMQLPKFPTAVDVNSLPSFDSSPTVTQPSSPISTPPPSPLASSTSTQTATPPPTTLQPASIPKAKIPSPSPKVMVRKSLPPKSLFDEEDMNVEAGKSPVAPPPAAAIVTPPPLALPRAKVLYAYQPQHPGDLELIVGTIVELTKTEGGWWEGKYQGNQGIFPANYVELL